MLSGEHAVCHESESLCSFADMGDFKLASAHCAAALIQAQAALPCLAY
jgi:hypothetical protein